MQQPRGDMRYPAGSSHHDSRSRSGLAHGTHNSTTLRFSRRSGETIRGCEYAGSIEGPARRTIAWLPLAVWALGLLATAVLILA